MEFAFEKSAVFSYIKESKDIPGWYLIFNYAWGAFLAPFDKVKVEIRPEIGKRTTLPLVCVEGYGTKAEVILVFGSVAWLRNYIEKGKIPQAQALRPALSCMTS